MALSDEQLANAKVIQTVGKQLGASNRDIQVAIMAALVESGLRNLNYGDRDSIGMFQQRDAWGSASARLDPYQSAKMFFTGGNAGQRGLLDLTNRATLSMGQAAQAVQVSAYPDRYAEREGEAGSIIGSLGGVAAPSQGGEVTLGSVPGIEDSIQAPVGTPVQPTTTEVNALGEVTADSTGIGALTFDPQGGPLGALEFGQAAVGQSQGAGPSQAPSGAPQAPPGGSAPTSSEPAPSTPGVHDMLIGAPAAPGEVFTGSFAGKDPYGLTEWDGETVDYMTAAALESAQKEFGSDFSVMQGSHNAGGVAASGGTHDGGGVIDISVPNGDWGGAVAAMRKIGFAAWVRNVDGYGQAGSGAHIHAVLMGNDQLSSQAEVQVNSYLNNDDGLVGSRADDGPRDYVNNRFSWGDAIKESRKSDPAAVRQAMKLVGLPHKWGGKDYDGLDGDGLVRKVFERDGIKLPKHITDLVANSPAVPIQQMAEGDLLAWGDHPQWGTPHYGVYLGSGLFAESRPGGQIQVSDLADAPSGYSAYAPPTPVETGPGLNQPVRSYDAPVSGMTRPPAPAPVAPAPIKPPVKSSNPAPGGHVADGYV